MKLQELIKNIVARFLFNIPKQLVCFLFFYHIRDRKVKKTPLVRLFVLDSERFREDLDVLRSNTNIEFIDFSFKLQDKVIGILERNLNKESEKNKVILHLAQYIEIFCNIYNVDGFISAGMWYKRHGPWEVASIDVGKVFYCLHREGVGVDEKILYRATSIFIKTCRKFQGTKVFVGSEIVRDFIVRSNYLPKSKVVATGLPKFDKVFNNINGMKNLDTNRQKTVVLFSFFVATSNDYVRTGHYPNNEGFRNLFDDVHAGMALYAINNPSVNVIIKMKWYSGEARNNVDNVIIRKTGVKPSNINNLSILDNIPAQELIIKSDVVVGFNSTTIVESILYRKKVIVPIFHEAINKYPDDVSYTKYKGVFYQANSLTDMIEKIDKCMDGSMPLLDIDYKFVDETAGFFDGQVCKRIENEII
jgi:hypothetical protein